MLVRQLNPKKVISPTGSSQFWVRISRTVHHTEDSFTSVACDKKWGAQKPESLGVVKGMGGGRAYYY